MGYWQNKVLHTGTHVVLVLQSRLVFVSLDNPDDPEIFTNLGYGETIRFETRITPTQISCRFSFDSYKNEYELVSVCVGLQRQLHCFTVDRDLLFVESDKQIISTNQGNTKALRYMYRRNG